MPQAVIAIGGNALTRAEEEGTIEQQFTNARIVCKKFVGLLEEGWDLVLTHGNGPQVGNMLWRAELAAQQIHPVDLGICDANSQGQIGYMLQQVFSNQLRASNVERTVVTLVSQIEVDATDPSFSAPSKPIGPFFTPEEAKEKQATGWVMAEDAGRGWRRLVPSPTPRGILEIDVVRHCVRAGFIPIALGGGGIPVVRRADGGFDGVEAVVDKDLSASLLARRLAADVLVICTAVPHVSVNFGKPGETKLGRVTAAELTGLLNSGEFPAGSMGPKVKACIDFVRGGGVGTTRRAVVTDMEHLEAALQGAAGTVVTME
ncbi:MAG: carbamate kinase [Longimicrobiales bacterium]